MFRAAGFAKPLPTSWRPDGSLLVERDDASLKLANGCVLELKVHLG